MKTGGGEGVCVEKLFYGQLAAVKKTQFYHFNLYAGQHFTSCN